MSSPLAAGADELVWPARGAHRAVHQARSPIPPPRRRTRASTTSRRHRATHRADPRSPATGRRPAVPRAASPDAAEQSCCFFSSMLPMNAMMIGATIGMIFAMRSGSMPPALATSFSTAGLLAPKTLVAIFSPSAVSMSSTAAELLAALGVPGGGCRRGTSLRPCPARSRPCRPRSTGTARAHGGLRHVLVDRRASSAMSTDGIMSMQSVKFMPCEFSSFIRAA